MGPQTKQALRDVGRRFGLDIRLNGLNSRDHVTKGSASNSRYPIRSKASSRRLRR